MSRIAITINTSWNIYNFRMGLVKALQKQGFEILAIAPRDEFSEILEKEGCKFIPLPMENKGANPFKDFDLVRRLYKIYKTNKPDIVLQFTIKPNIYGTLAARMAGIPVINNVSGLGTVFLHNNLVSSVARLLYKVAFRYPEKVFFQNQDDLNLFLEKRLVSKNLTGLLPGSGVNLEKFVPAEFKKNEPFVFLVIARLLYDKGIVEFAEAARILRNKGYNYRFQIMGALDPGRLGVPEKMLQDWIDEGLIEFIPFHKDIRPYIADADCVVLPSYREGTPKTLLEAAAMAKPLIATDVPGCKEVVCDNENGYLCTVKSAADLSHKMELMASKKEQQLRVLGENSRKLVVLKYDEKFVVRAYLEEIDKILPGIIKFSLI